MQATYVEETAELLEDEYIRQGMSELPVGHSSLRLSYQGFSTTCLPLELELGLWTNTRIYVHRRDNIHVGSGGT